MPRRIADDGASLADGTSSNVLFTEDHAYLTSRNRFPNGDLDDNATDGSLRYWTLEAIPRITGWFPYYADKPGDPQYRQEFEANGIRRDAWKLDRDWIKGVQPPDSTDRTRVGQPDRPAVDLVPLDTIGFAVDTYYVAIIYGFGPHTRPRRDLRWTEPGEYAQIQVTDPGSGIEVTLPTDRPEGITWYGIAVKKGSLSAPAFVQDFVGVAHGVPPSKKLRGPYSRTLRASDRNTTYIGNNFPHPRVIWSSANPSNRRQRAAAGLDPGQYQFRIKPKTQFGWGPAGIPTPWVTIQSVSRTYVQAEDGSWVPASFYGNQIPAGAKTKVVDEGSKTCALWVAAVGVRGIPLEAVSIEVRGRKDAQANETEWQTLTSGRGMIEFQPGQFYPVHSFNAENYPGSWSLQSATSGEMEDTSGVPDPESELEAPTEFGGAPLTPGNKRVGATWAYRERDELGRVEEHESVLSPQVRVQVPGVSGAATHTIRIHRPPGANQESNPRFVRLKKDEREEDWIRDPEGPSGAVFGPQVGYSELTDTTNATTNQAVYYTAPVELGGRKKAVRMAVEMTSWTGGRAVVDLEFLDANGGVLRTDRIGRRARLGETFIHRTIGPQGSKDVNHRYPSAATHYRRVFRHIGSTSSGPRNFTVRYQDIGTYPGLAHPLKRYDVEEVDRLVEEDFPVGGYCSVLSRALVDRENIRPRQNIGTQYRERIDFDDGVPADVVLVGNTFLTDDQPIGGTQSLRLDASAGPARVRYTLDSPKDAVDWILRWRLDTLPATQFPLQRVMSGANQVGMFRYNPTDGNLKAVTTNAAGTQTVTDAAVDIDPFEDIYAEIEVRGANTAFGSVRYYLSREGHRPELVAEHTGIDLTGRAIDFVDAGPTVTSTTIMTVDDMEVFARSDEWEDIPGRIVEYFGPEGTPLHPDNFMRAGLDDNGDPKGIPVVGGVEQIMSVFVEHRGTQAGTAPLQFVSVDEAGNILRRHGSLTGELAGRRRMHRRYKVFTPHPDADHIRFTGGPVGAGLIRVGGFQLEGMTNNGRPTRFTNEHASTGFVQRTFPMRVPGVPSSSALGAFNRLERYRRAEARGQTPAGTSIAVSFASGPTSEGPWSPMTNDLDAVPLDEHFLIRADLQTTDLQTTPELEELILDFLRDGPVVCRADGTEVPGGAVPVDFPAIQPQPNMIVETRADNTPAFATFGRRQRRADGWKIEAYYDAGVRALVNQIGRGESTLTVEEFGVRSHVQIFDLKFPAPDRTMNYPIAGQPFGGFDFDSDDIQGMILSEEAL